jgi:hypothetical protein
MRRQGNSKLVYDKQRRTIITVRQTEAEAEELRRLYAEIAKLRAVRDAAREVLALGILNPTGSARVEAATQALAAAIEASR